MQIKVLGPGCARCRQLEANAREAAKQLGLDCEIEKVADFQEYPKYGLMMTPGLVVDGRLKVQGKLASVDEIKALLA